MNAKHFNKIITAIIEGSQISFDYSNTSGSYIRFKGTPLLLRSNKAGDFFLAAKRAGYGYATWSLNKMKNVRVHIANTSKYETRSSRA